MSTPVNVSEAKARLSELIDRALQGEEVVIARRNKPVVRLVSVAPEGRQVRVGRFAGKGHIAPDFDDPIDDFAEHT